jgi:leucyl aminopeptidase
VVAAVPTPPTKLVDVEVITKPRRGVPLAVVACPPEDEESKEPRLGPHADRLGVDADWLITAGVSGEAGTVHPVVVPGAAAVGWLVGVGKGGAGKGGAGMGGGGMGGGGRNAERDYRRAGAALLRAADARAAADAKAGRPVARGLQVALPEGVSAELAAAFALGAVLGGYSFRVTAQDRPERTRTVSLIATQDVQEAVDRALVLARATALTRDLANTPSNVKDPDWLASTAARIAGTVPGLNATVRDEDWLREHGFGGVLAVGGGSSRPPRMVELSWRPRGAKRHLALVGKGITFDTGGISIKPAQDMHVMRTDMAGGAAVISALVAVARLNLPVRVTGLVPLAENHVSGSAYRPGDIVRHYDRRTTEVTNTDAEGRMVLADALGYAVRTLKPDVLVDVATLTGAMRITLGMRTGGFFATDDDLAEALVAAGERAGESWWRLPLGFDLVDVATGHAEPVHSEIADVRQCPPGPGAISAALFLREFTGGLRWAHLDIAGSARSDKPQDELPPSGATGFAARTLVELASGLG